MATGATHQGFSSSSSSSKPWIYDVYLSFRGEDTRKGFTGHLYMALQDAGIEVFMDDPVLQRGAEVAPELVRAIEGSQISLIIFSRNYAASTWCLDELVKIMECRERVGQLVCPIYYHVDPGEVKRQTGSFADAFKRHEDRFRLNLDKVQNWRAALTQAANLPGYIADGLESDSEFIRKIIDGITRTLHKTNLPSSRVKDMYSQLSEPVQAMLPMATDTTHQVFSSTSRSSKPDVYLSFRGEDTRIGFTSHLYTALQYAGIKVFLEHDLPRGANIVAELLQVIEGSKIFVIIFSTNYAASRWCLDELAKIMECRETEGQLVMPIFYDVDPLDVRHQTGSFARAFAQHEKRFGLDMEKVQRWREALKEAANLSGWVLNNIADGYEAKFIKKIVDEISRRLHNTNLPVAAFPVGIDDRVSDMSYYLGVESDDVRMVGIWGRSGIGKTTVAKAVYNEFSRSFEGSSFLANVREVTEQPNGMVALQEQLLCDILKTNKIKVDSVDGGINMIKQRFRVRKVLVIIDDIDQREQLNKLANRHWFGSGSRIVLTTRHQKLLKQLEVDTTYPAQAMNELEALELLSWHAFRNSYPKKGYFELSERVVACCGGLPLVLQGVGTFLFGKRKAEWKGTLEKLERTSNHARIKKNPRRSFDVLCQDQKDIFFPDMSRKFFTAKYLDEPIKRRLWHHEDGFVLTEKSGTQTDEILPESLEVADSYSAGTTERDLILCQGSDVNLEQVQKQKTVPTEEKVGEPSRLRNDEIVLIRENTVIKWWDYSWWDFFSVWIDFVKKVIKVILTAIMGTQIDERNLHVQPTNAPRNPIENMEPNKRRDLEKQTAKLTQEEDAKEYFADLEKKAVNLKELFLYCSLFPSGYEFRKDELVQLWIAEGFIGENQSERMEDIGSACFDSLQDKGFFLRSRCDFGVDFDSVFSVPIYNPSNFLYKVDPIKLPVLENTISQGDYFRAVDPTLDGACEMTQHMSLICEDIDEMTFGVLQKFKYLHTLLLLSGCGSNIKHIPPNLFLSLKFLRTLNLSQTSIYELPSSIRNVKTLRYLDVSNTPITRLPESIDSLHNLQTIKLRGCIHFVQLPKDMKKLINLRHIDLDITRQLDSMPAHLGNLTKLQTLSAFLVGRDDGCRIGELKNLNDLKGALRISRLENVLAKKEAEEAALMDKKFLHRLDLRWSNLLTENTEEQEKILDCLEPHCGLRELQIQNYGGLMLPTWISSPSFADLVVITLYRCKSCTLLPSIGQLPALKFLSIIEMNEVEEISHQFFRNDLVDQAVPAFPKLERLELDIMLNLKEWKAIHTGDLPSLLQLTVNRCPELVTLPSLSCLTSLKHLEFRCCKKLLSLPSDGVPYSLESFIIIDCPELKRRCLDEDLSKISKVPSIWFDYERMHPIISDMRSIAQELEEARRRRRLPHDKGLDLEVSTKGSRRKVGERRKYLQVEDFLKVLPEVHTKKQMEVLTEVKGTQTDEILPKSLEVADSYSAGTTDKDLILCQGSDVNLEQVQKQKEVPTEEKVGEPSRLRNDEIVLIRENTVIKWWDFFSVWIDFVKKVIKVLLTAIMGTQIDERNLHVQPTNAPRNPIENMEPNKRRDLEKQTAKLTQEEDAKEYFADLEKKAVNLKELFLYCSLFPSGYEFRKDELVQLWIAEGFIGENQSERMEDIGSACFDSLQDKGFFLRSRCDFGVDFDSVFSVPIYNPSNFLYKVDPIKLPVLENTISQGDYFRAVDPTLDGACEMTQHMSLICEDIDEMTFGVLQKFKYLHTLLLLSGCGSNIKHIPPNLFLSLKFLRTLNLSQTSIYELPSSIRNVKTLRYLDVSNTPITRLPESIDSLHNLQTIKLRGCIHFVQLPKDMKKLINLRHIDLDITRQLDSMPAHLGNLTKLQTLSAFLVGRDDGCRIGELKNLNDLKGALRISRLENVLAKKEAEEAALMDKKFLHRLDLRWSNLLTENTEEQEKILDCLEPHCGLRELQIQNYGGLMLPTWISSPSFADLVVITLYRCKSCTLLPSIGQLPALKFLSIIEMNEVEEISHQFFRNDLVDQAVPAFPKLERLELDIMLNLKEWKAIHTGDLPSLLQLTVNRCPELVTLPSLSCLTSLKHLEFRCCKKLLSLPSDGVPYSLESLIIIDCPELN